MKSFFLFPKHGNPVSIEKTVTGDIRITTDDVADFSVEGLVSELKELVKYLEKHG